MLLHVLHETVYAYAPPVRTAQHVLHLQPASTLRQRLVSHRLLVEPQPGRQSASRDVFGNTRTFLSLQFPHDALRVLADSVVATSPAGEVSCALPWEAVVESLRYHRDARYDPAAEFAFASPYVPRDARFAAYAQASFPPGRPLLEAARDLMRRIHAEFEYAPEVTDVHTPALEALGLRKGVCQDLAHVMLGCLRSLGLPARYVSGYLHTGATRGGERLLGADASHAWVAVYVPGEPGRGCWVEFDPTNDRTPGEDYVTLATGRDYSDVSPLRGVIRGGADHSLRVAVTVTPAPAG